MSRSARRQLGLRTAALLLLSLTLSSCVPSLKGEASGYGEAEALPSPSATYGESRPVNGDGRVVMKPISVEVEEGVAYRFELYTHCGVGHFVDFDGSFWDALGGTEEGSSRHGFDDPTDKGIMTLISEDRAEYMGSTDKKVMFERHRGHFVTLGCM